MLSKLLLLFCTHGSSEMYDVFFARSTTNTKRTKDRDARTCLIHEREAYAHTTVWMQVKHTKMYRQSRPALPNRLMEDTLGAADSLHFSEGMQLSISRGHKAESNGTMKQTIIRALYTVPPVMMYLTIAIVHSDMVLKPAKNPNPGLIWPNRCWNCYSRYTKRSLTMCRSLVSECKWDSEWCYLVSVLKTVWFSPSCAKIAATIGVMTFNVGEKEMHGVTFKFGLTATSQQTVHASKKDGKIVIIAFLLPFIQFYMFQLKTEDWKNY